MKILHGVNHFHSWGNAAGDVVRIKEKALILLCFVLGISFLGCSTTIHEKKATESDPGNETQLKFTGRTLKAVHNF